MVFSFHAVQRFRSRAPWRAAGEALRCPAVSGVLLSLPTGVSQALGAVIIAATIARCLD